MAGFDALPPWEAAPWFQTVKVTYVTTGMGSTLLVGGDPMRTGLIISTVSNSIFMVGIDPTRDAGGKPGGLALTSGSPILLLTFAEYGPLIQQAWYAADAFGSNTVTVYEILLRDWPRPKVQRGQQSPNAPQPASRRRDQWPDATAGA